MQDDDDKSSDFSYEDYSFDEAIPLPAPDPNAPPEVLPFSQMLRTVVAALQNNNVQRAQAILDAYLDSGRQNLQRQIETEEFQGLNDLEDSTDDYIEWISADTNLFYGRALFLSCVMNCQLVMERLCRLFYMLDLQPHNMEIICEQLGEGGYIDCIGRLCEANPQYRTDILNAAMLGAVRNDSHQTIGALRDMGANIRIAELCLPAPQGELSLRLTIQHVLQCLNEQVPHAAQIWLERYIDDCVTRASITIDDNIVGQPNGPTLAERVAQDLTEQISFILENEDGEIEGGPTIDLLMHALLLARRTERGRLINHLCQIMAAVVENEIDLSDLWDRLIGNNDFATIRTIRLLVRNEEERTYIFDICLVCAVRICNITAVRVFLGWGASPRIALIGRHRVPGGDFDPDIHMPLLDLCIRNEFVGGNYYVALILLAHGAPSCVYQNDLEINCMTISILNRQWDRVARLCMLGVSCTNHMQAIAQNPDNVAFMPSPAEASLVLQGMSEALVLICRLSPGLRGTVWHFFYEPAINTPTLIISLRQMSNTPFYVSIREEILNTLVLLEENLGDLHRQLTQGLSVITGIEFPDDHLQLFLQACASQHPPTLTELLAWIRLYELNNPQIMSRHDLFALIQRRCFPEHQ